MASAVASTPQDLPIPLTSCVGRARDATEVRRLLDTSRLLTLTGVGGVGKTRLALEVATEALPYFADGVRFVDLTPLADPALVLQVTAAACGAREGPGRPLMAALVDALRTQRLLLVLDNCEHLVEACAELVDALLATCPQLHLLATSREALGVAGETVWPVSPLAAETPDAEESFPASAGAVELFVERARALTPGFALGPGDRALVVEICRRLDGLPLAIELAAARTRALTLQELLRRLDDRFRLLTTGSRTSPRHQQTLRAAMDWSHDLLGEPERVLFRRLSVFAGGFTLQAAETICPDFGFAILDFGLTEQPEGESTSPSPPSQSKILNPKSKIEQEDVLDLLARLVDKSLVTTAAPAGAGRPTRYRLLETVRQYGADKLRESGEEADLRRQHASCYLALAESAAPALTGPEQAAWMDRLDSEHDNIRQALRWAIDGGEVVVALRLGGALWRFWQARGYLTEGLRWLEEALARGDDAPAPIRAAALTAAGNLALARGAPVEARRLHQANLDVWRTTGDRSGIAAALRNLGLVAVDQGDLAAAHALFDESLALERQLGDRWRIALALHCLGTLARDEGDLDRAQLLSAESLALFQTLGDTRTACLALMALGSLALDREDLPTARARNEEALESYHALADRRGIALALNQLAKVAYAAGTYAEAAGLCADSLVSAETLGIRRVAVSCLEVLAAIAHQTGQHEVSAQLFGAAAAFRQATGTVAPPTERRLYDRLVGALRDQLGAATYVAAWTAGESLLEEQANALALEVAATVRDSVTI